MSPFATNIDAATTSHLVVTPARNEAENLTRLARSLAEQTVPVTEWVVVDNGSTDATAETVEALAREHGWIRLMRIPGEQQSARGRLSVRAFNAGYESSDRKVDFISNIDADVSLPPTYFEELFGRFADDPRVGIASGLCYEEVDGTWKPVHVTSPFLRGALLTCRLPCFDEIKPFEERVGWDGVACVLANARGWTTLLVDNLPYRHHRPTGVRDRSRWTGWRLEGETVHYMWYRPTYLIARAAFHAPRDPSALALIDGYLRAALRRDARYPDDRFRSFVRSQQRLRNLPLRRREILGRTSPDSAAPTTAQPDD